MRNRYVIGGLIVFAAMVSILLFGRVPTQPTGGRIASGQIGALAAFRHQASSNAPLAIATDGTVIAVGTETGEVLLYSAVTGEELQRFGSFADSVSALAFAESGTRLFAGRGLIVSSWSWPEREPQPDIVTAHPQHRDQVISSIHPSWDGRSAFLLFSHHPRIRKHDNFASGPVLHVEIASGHSREVGLGYGPFAPQIGTAVDDRALVNFCPYPPGETGSAREYDFATGEVVATSHPSFRYGPVAASRAGLIAGFRHKPPILVDGLTPTATGGEVWLHPSLREAGEKCFETVGIGVQWMTFARDGRTLVLAKWNGEIEFRDTTSGRLTHAIPSRPRPDAREKIHAVRQITLSTNADTLAAMYADGLVAIWDIKLWLAAPR